MGSKDLDIPDSILKNILLLLAVKKFAILATRFAKNLPIIGKYHCLQWSSFGDYSLPQDIPPKWVAGARSLLGAT